MIYMKTSDLPMEFFVVDKSIKIVKKIEIKWDKDKEIYYENKSRRIGNFDFDEIYKLGSIDDDFTPIYSITVKYGEKNQTATFKGTIDEIVGKIKMHGGLIYQTREASDLIQNAIIFAKKTFNLITKEEPPYPGFFHMKGKLISTVEYNYPSATEIREAIELLHELSKEYEEFKYGLGYVLHWQIIAPFSFVKKQKGNSDKVGALYLYGSSRAGKTTTAQLSSHIWGRRLQDCFVGAGELHSEASYGKNISEHTFPVVLDEAERIFNPRNEGLASVFKNSVLYQNARGRYSPVTKTYENIPALSAPIITSNASQPTNAALGGRMHSIEYIMTRPRSKEEIMEFNRKFDPENDNGPLKALNCLGAFAANYVMANPELIDEPWEKLSEILWDAIYEYGSTEMPDFMVNYGGETGLEEAWEEEEEELSSNFKTLILRKADWGSNYVNGEDHTEPTQETPLTMEDRVKDVIFHNKEPWLNYNVPSRGRNAGKHFVEISSGISQEMYKEYGIRPSLKILCNELHGEIVITKDKFRKSSKVARWELEDFLGLFRTEEE